MPLYEYYCPPCGTRFELLRPASKMDDLAVCPMGHTTNNRVISLFAPVSKSTQGGTATLTATDIETSTGGGACSCGGSGCC
jgi:putative FmdB family regulatory protein